MVEQCIDASTPDVQHSAIKYLMFRRLGELCSAPIGGARQPGRLHCGHSGRHIVRRQLAPFLGGGSRAGGCSFTELHLFQGLPHNTLCSLFIPQQHRDDIPQRILLPDQPTGMASGFSNSSIPSSQKCERARGGPSYGGDLLQD